jgi:hypothetical protein
VSSIQKFRGDYLALMEEAGTLAAAR